jgi:hypothetical protein
MAAGVLRSVGGQLVARGARWANAMPRFFFHVQHDGGVVPDAKGLVLPDIGAAREHSAAIAACISGILSGPNLAPLSASFVVEVAEGPEETALETAA